MARRFPSLHIPALGLTVLLLTACTSAAPGAPTVTPEPSPTTPPNPAAAPTVMPPPTATPDPELQAAILQNALGSFEPFYVWNTDFSKALVPAREIQYLGLPRDAIPPLYSPQWVSVQEADSWLSEYEPVVGVEVNGEARAYPLQVLISHEVVDDQLGGVPIGVTY